MQILTLSEHITESLHRKFLLESLDAYQSQFGDQDQSIDGIRNFTNTISEEKFKEWLDGVFQTYFLNVKVFLKPAEGDNYLARVPEVSLELDDEDALILKLSEPEFFK